LRDMPVSIHLSGITVLPTGAHARCARLVALTQGLQQLLLPRPVRINSRSTVNCNLQPRSKSFAELSADALLQQGEIHIRGTVTIPLDLMSLIRPGKNVCKLELIIAVPLYFAGCPILRLFQCNRSPQDVAGLP